MPPGPDADRLQAEVVALHDFVAQVTPDPASAASAATPAAMLTASAAPDVPADQVLAQGQLDAAVAQATAEWQAVAPTADLGGVSFGIGDLPGLELGSEGGAAVTIDADA